MKLSWPELADARSGGVPLRKHGPSGENQLLAGLLRRTEMEALYET